MNRGRFYVEFDSASYSPFVILITSGTVIKRVSRVPGVTFRHTFLSINRFEKKKNIALAIEAFATLVRQQEDSQLSSLPRKLVRLVVAGGLPAAKFCFFYMLWISFVELTKIF